VKIFGGGKLGGVNQDSVTVGLEVLRTEELLLIQRRAIFARDGVLIETWRLVCSSLRLKLFGYRVVQPRPCLRG
jgi:hypothetical protein